MKRALVLFAITAVIALQIFPAYCDEYSPLAGDKACFAVSNAVYTQIGVDSGDELESGTNVDVLEVIGDWAKISYMDTEFYVPSDILTASDDEYEESLSVSSTGRTFYLSRDCDFLCEQSGISILFKAGEPVTMLDSEQEKARVLHAGVMGYIPVDALALTPDFTYGLGLEGDSIRPMQKRLEELGYFDGVANGILDIDTVDAVLRFRKISGMTDVFEVEDGFREKLYSQNAEPDPIRILSLGLSDAGGAVLRLQKRLIKKGYLVDTPTGYYDTMTSQAVTLFQSMNGLDKTSLANTLTMRALFSSDARKLPRNLMPVSPETTIYMPGSVINPDWWESDIQQVFSLGTVATVTDVDTGLSWREMRRGGTNHADCQPLTAQDTQILLSAAQGKWTWDRRAVWVSINGVKYAASMNCMPHGEGEIKDNDFNGHHCIHFLNSRTHASNRLDERHQACVSKAAGLPYDEEIIKPKPQD